MQKTIEGLVTPFVAIVIAVLIGAVVMLMTGHNPLTAYGALFSGAFGSTVNLSNTMANAIPLILSGLGVAIAFKAGLFNIGAEGQYWIGSMAAVWIGYSVHGLPPILHISLSIIVAMLAAGLWAGIVPGLAKAFVGAHEVITTMMMSYIAIFLSHYMLENGPMMQTGFTPQSPVILPSATLGKIVERTQLSWGLAIAVVACIIVYWLLYKTTLGYRLRAVGLNSRAANYAGINVPFHLVLALFISGMLAGLAGAVQMLGVQHRLYDSFSSGYGFTAIVVALLANNNPFGVILASIFFAALSTGGQSMQLVSGVPAHLTAVISGIIIFLVATKDIVQIQKRWRKRQTLASGKEA
ncbi:ABC transporter permease [Desulfosporosinus sp. BICA1-9]|uniref:ABC transporter permease n=1 Tax=Desulfosporosinus sp. BICA1-9 TaxID=1531958 RepID=UPI00054C0D96|nr:ABC transporter permease [Desulfosporosinus sp. BICA1-9]KJS47705.1 MAG: ABC transporter permease [Peptococcaceae bacterium BRH_c23]KJS89402.1 MAG: ABC transporter permease [Desulfosporosinus sp. BICA1-9]HBW36614.1 ABC transporter permease [Desulfosporosinus sp.]